MAINIKQFEKSRFTFYGNMESCKHHLDSTWKLIEEEWENPSPILTRCNDDRWDVSTGDFSRNLLFVGDEFKENHINDIRQFLIESGTKEALEKVWDSNIGVCNVRAYRYTHNPPVEKTHYKDKITKYNNIPAHRDGLVEGSVKAMFYRTGDGDLNLTVGHSVTELLLPANSTNETGQWYTPTGLSPIGVLFWPNEILHKADTPEPGKIRDCIEMTIMKRELDDFRVDAVGGQSGYPKDVEAWNRNYK